MARRETKTVALTVASGVLTFGVQQLTAGEITTGAVGIVIGLVLFTGYQFAEETDHGKAYSDLVDAIGEDTFKQLSEMGGDRLKDLTEGRDGS